MKNPSSFSLSRGVAAFPPAVAPRAEQWEKMMKSAIIALAATSSAAIAQDDMNKVERGHADRRRAGGQTVMPSNADPEHDARIAVIPIPRWCRWINGIAPLPVRRLRRSGGYQRDSSAEATTPDATYRLHAHRHRQCLQT